MTEFRREWTAFHGDTVALAFELQDIEAKPWVRFHAMPDSQRYADNDAERREIHRRAAILGNQILVAGAPCWLVQYRQEYDRDSDWRKLEAEFDPDLDYYEDRRTAFDTEPWGVNWSGFARPVIWDAEVFRELLRDVAEERTGPTLFMSRETGQIFAPYDGGFDIFPATADHVAALKSQYSNWLSDHPSGL